MLCWNGEAYYIAIFPSFPEFIICISLKTRLLPSQAFIAFPSYLRIPVNAIALRTVIMLDSIYYLNHENCMNILIHTLQ